MLRIAVMVSGGGTNLQAIINSLKDGKITNAQIVRVISNKAEAKALERARNAGIDAVSVERKNCAGSEDFNKKLLAAIDEAAPDLIVLAGFLVVIFVVMAVVYHHYASQRDRADQYELMRYERVK